jgi:HK97 family phage prohead protease
VGLWAKVRGFIGLPTATFTGPPSTPFAQYLWELGGRGTGPVSRDLALTVPAVLRARNMICSIATLPLVLVDADREPVRTPLLEQFDPDVPNVVHLTQTLEDLLFDSIAWWRITGFGWDGYPSQVRRLDPATVTLNPPNSVRAPAPLPHGRDPRQAVVWVDGAPVPAAEIIRFDSPNPPVLVAGARSIRRAVLLEQAAAMYAENPRPLDYFQPKEGADPADDDAVREILTAWRAARKQGATAYVPAALEHHTVDQPTPADLQLVQLQERAALDLANILGIDPEDVGVSTTSRTYANAVDRRRDRINDTLSPYMKAITDRLSMGDVTKRGQRVRWDLDDYMRANPTERVAYYQGLEGMGVVDAEWIRAEEDIPGKPPRPKPTPAPPPTVPDGTDALPPPPVRSESTATPAHTFADADRLTFADMEVTGFSVDREARIIEGLAMPYGKVGMKGGTRYRFAKGALRWTDPGRVKLLRDHDPRQPLGRAVSLTESHQGLKVRFKVARGPAGDEALALAEDGVLDGLSAGVDFMAGDAATDPRDRSTLLVNRADLREVSLTAMPAFDDARVTSVAASRTAEGETMPDVEPTTVPADPAGQAPARTFAADEVAAMLAAVQHRPADPPAEPTPADTRQVVNPTRPAPVTFVAEALPYRFDRGGNFVPGQEHVFSADLHAMAQARDVRGDQTDAGRRVMALLRATFDVDSADINEVTPSINRPDMYVDQREYRTPLWNFVNKGAPPNGITPFIFPKFSSASGLVGDHTEGTEPTGGTLVTTNQTVTPSALSGKAYITREVWDMGGNPAVSTLIWNQMVRGYREGLESATATFLNTLTAATDITLPAGSADETLAAAWEAAVADLQFIRGYDFEAFALEKELYKKFAAARDASERPLYPILSPSNANGTAASRFRTLDLAGVTGVPSWALASTAGSPNNSWLFDPTTVHGWATAPQRLEFPGGSDDNTTYQPVAKVGLGIWGYKAFANSDIGGVRQVIYDTTA